MVKSIIDPLLQIEVYKKHRNNIFQSNGKAKPATDEIYKTLVGALNGMSAKAIQTSINRNVQKILDDQVVEPTSAGNGSTHFLPEIVDVEEDIDTVEETCDENESANPLQFVDVSVGIEGNSETDGDDTQETEHESIEDKVNRDNISLRSLYHKGTVQEETEDIHQIHESINKLVNSYRDRIAKIGESHRNISSSFQNNLKSANDEESMKLLEASNTKASELEIQLSSERKAFREEINRLNQKDEESMKLLEASNTKASELEIRLSSERKAFDEEINRLNQKDEESMKLLEASNTKASELEIQLSSERKAFDEEINRLNQKDEESMKLSGDSNTKASESGIQSRKRSRQVDIKPRKKRIRECVNQKN